MPASAAAQDLVVYSSLPLRGASAPQTRGVLKGIDLALRDAGGKAGGRTVRHVSFDDSTRRARTWVPEQVARNARRAAQDARTIAYIGEFNSGACAISIPILNEAGILQVSPSATAIGLTQGGPGAERGEPDKYYPTGERSFGRVMPNDRVEAGAAAALMKTSGRTRVLFVHDGEIFGRGLARLAAEAARSRGIEVVGMRRLRRRHPGELARVARRSGADGVFYGGVTANGAVGLWRALARVPDLQLFSGEGVAESGFTRRIGRSAAQRTRLLVSTLAPEAHPAAGQDVFRRLGTREPYAIYGYEAMSLVLDAINRGGARQQGAREAFFATRDRDSVLGRYSIDEFGDTSLTQYGVYRVEGGALVWDGVADAAVG